MQQRIGPEPDRSDIEVLDKVYMTRILRLIWDLEDALGPFEKLFRDTHQISYISFRGRETNSSGLLQAGNWERTKTQYIVTQGFKLKDDNPLNIEHQFVFSGHTGNLELESDLVLSISWQLASESLTRKVSINQEFLPELEDSILYFELGDRSVDTDLTVAKIMTGLMERMINSSGG